MFVLALFSTSEMRAFILVENFILVKHSTYFFAALFIPWNIFKSQHTLPFLFKNHSYKVLEYICSEITGFQKKAY